MATIDFEGIDIPIMPGGYDDLHPHRQRENLCGVVLQMLKRAQDAKMIITDEGVQAVKDLQYNGTVIDIGGDVKLVLWGKTLVAGG